MAERLYKLRSRTMGVLAEDDQRRLVVIPANAVVSTIDGDLGGNGYIKIRYGEQELEIFALDLRERGEAASEQSG